MLNKVTIIGVGLIGGSFAKALKRHELAKEVCGFGRNQANLERGIELNVIDRYTLDPQIACQNAELILLAVPVGAMEATLRQIQPFIEPNTILTDAGSSKMSVLEAVENVFGALPENFVAGHPIAGKEQSGVEAASSILYENHRVILTPTQNTNQNALSEVNRIWTAIGAIVSEMSPEHHDEVLAATSHLPHLLAFGLVDLLSEHNELGDVFQYTAGGFRDFTRIASSDAVMWRDIALNNKQAIIKWLKNYQSVLSQMSTMLETDDEAALHQLFSNAKQARDTHILKINRPEHEITAKKNK